MSRRLVEKARQLATLIETFWEANGGRGLWLSDLTAVGVVRRRCRLRVVRTGGQQRGGRSRRKGEGCEKFIFFF